jgi:hypothetical protein
MKVKACERGASCVQQGPARRYFKGTAYEQDCWDPKGGELCLTRAKPEETLVEARSRSDVQIDGQSWV